MLTLKECQDIIHRHLGEIKLPETPRNLYAPVRYMLEPEGKRMRPVLVLMACNLFSDDIRKAINPALAVEIFHNFTLMHDDIMDKSVIRRSRPTVHVKWDQNIGILSGDAMLIKSYELLSATPQPLLGRILGLFNATAIKVCEGQQYDMDFEQGTETTLAEYLKMVELKTAVLVAASLKIGAIMGGADGKEADSLYEFGRNIGIAFQLQDDLMDAYADPQLFGKAKGNDIVSNKKTVLLIQALRLARGQWKKELQKWLEAGEFNREEKIRQVMKLYDHLNLQEITKSKIEFYHGKAHAILNDLPCVPERKAQLSLFCESLLTRSK